MREIVTFQKGLFTGSDGDRRLVILSIATGTLVFLGPFGTDELSLGGRIVYWVALMVGVGIFMNGGFLWSLQSPALAQIPKFFRLAIASLLAAIPGTAAVFMVEAAVRPPMPDAELFWPIWYKVALMGLIIGTIEHLDPRRLLRSATPDEPALPHIPLHDRLPTDLGTDVISLSMQDHYVEVTTTKGAHLVLMRMSDALREVEALPGTQIHRSHWVAARHINDLARSGNRMLAKLSDGRELPVSKTYLKAARALLD